jgi:hypothetical protein
MEKLTMKLKILYNSGEIIFKKQRIIIAQIKKFKKSIKRLSYVYPHVIFHSFIGKQLINGYLLHWSYAMTHAKMQPKYFMDVPKGEGSLMRHDT